MKVNTTRARDYGMKAYRSLDGCRDVIPGSAEICLDGIMSTLSRIILFVCLLLLGGCFIPIKYDVSLAGEIPPGYPAKTSGHTIIPALPELTVSARILVYERDGRYLPGPLGAWIEADAADGRSSLDSSLP